MRLAEEITENVGINNVRHWLPATKPMVQSLGDFM
jgi:hypothetical protein